MNERGVHEPEHDAWLRAALAHAPDAGIGAPPALSEAILRAAAGTRAAAPRSPWQSLMDAWSWLARPPVAAGFASVMVAGVVGLMWWERPIDEVMPRSPVPSAAPASIPAPAITSAPAETAAPARIEEQRRKADTPPLVVRAAVKPAPAADAARRESAAPAAETPPTPAAPPPAPQVAAEDAVRLRRAEPAVAEATVAEAAPAMAQGAAAAGPSVRMPTPDSPPASATPRAAAKTAGPARADLFDRAVAMSPLAPLLSRWPATPDTWRWLPPGATAAQPADAAARHWLERVEAATRGRWSARSDTAVAAAAVIWWQGDAPLGSLHFEPDGLAWLGADGRRAFAPLDAASLATLRLP